MLNFGIFIHHNILYFSIFNTFSLVEVHLISLNVIVVNESILILLLTNFYTVALHWNVWELVLPILGLLHVQWEVLVIGGLITDLLVVDFWTLKSSFDILIFRV